MEIQKKKCRFNEHKDIDANIYCKECKIYMCKKCEVFHSKLLENHQIINIEKIEEEIFSGCCQEKNHNNNTLEFFCKDHSQLCCVACICKIKKGDLGKHKDCIVYNIEEIKDEKIKSLKENIKCLEELSISLEESINDLRKIFDKINNKKEELKLNIQKIFTKFRNELRKI